LQILVTVRFGPRTLLGSYNQECFHSPDPKLLIQSVRQAAEGGARNIWIMNGEYTVNQKEVKHIADRLERYRGVRVFSYRTYLKVHVEMNYRAMR
jgi:hypothetical protein